MGITTLVILFSNMNLILNTSCVYPRSENQLNNKTKFDHSLHYPFPSVNTK